MTLHASSEPEVEKPPDNDNEVFISDAKTQQIIKNQTIMLR